MKKEIAVGYEGETDVKLRGGMDRTSFLIMERR